MSLLHLPITRCQSNQPYQHDVLKGISLMDSSSKTSVLLAKTFLLFFVLILLAIFLIKPPLISSVARAQGERVFDNAVPENAPFRIKIKKEKEKSFKDLKDENWVREFELEVTNTGDKPIYFL
jgi:hypothetical protein